MWKKLSFSAMFSLLIVFSQAEPGLSLEKSVQEVGNQVDINFSGESPELSKIENLIKIEEAYNNINSDLISLAASLQETLVKLDKLKINKAIDQSTVSAEIRKTLNVIDSVNKTESLIKTIPLKTYVNPIEVANTLARIDTTDRPEILEIKLPETIFGPLPTINEPKNQPIYLTWELTIKSRNLMDQITVSAPPDFRPWGFVETNKNVDNQYVISFLSPKPEPTRDSIILKSRKFLDGWIYETYLGQFSTLIDTNLSYIQFEARTNLVKLSTCPVFILTNPTNSKITRLPDTSLCQSKLQNIKFPNLSRNENALRSSQFSEIQNIFNNRIKFNELASRLSTYHELDMLLKNQLETDIINYKNFLKESNQFIENKLSESKSKRLQVQKDISKNTIKTITCIKGKLIKKISAVNPKCPVGFKIK